jgi:hypothetical protein
VTRLFAIVLVIHGLIHLLGFVKAFGWADLPALTQPISTLFGLVWLTACGLFFVTALAVVAWPRWWWAPGAAAVSVSMLAISQSWTDARAGAVANLLVLVGILVGGFFDGPFSRHDP